MEVSICVVQPDKYLANFLRSSCCRRFFHQLFLNPVATRRRLLKKLHPLALRTPVRPELRQRINQKLVCCLPDKIRKSTWPPRTRRSQVLCDVLMSIHTWRPSRSARWAKRRPNVAQRPKLIILLSFSLSTLTATPAARSF